jgi:hypothetical protein
MEDESRVFSKMPLRNVISWDSILVGFAMHWHGNIPWLYSFLAHLFEMMLFCLLSACGHAGPVDEGMRCYGAMDSIYMISEELEHYTFMVDLLGCVGHPQETENMNKSMP